MKLCTAKFYIYQLGTKDCLFDYHFATMFSTFINFSCLGNHHSLMTCGPSNIKSIFYNKKQAGEFNLFWSIDFIIEKQNNMNLELNTKHKKR